MNISLIIPVWNASLFLEASLQTLRDQSQNIHQIIVIDDKSDMVYKQSHIDICQRYDAEYYYLDAKTKLKRRAECNQFGIQYVTGEVIGFICVDQVYRVNYIEKLIWVLSRYDNIALFHASKALPYFKPGTKIMMVRFVVELIRTGEIDSYTIPNAFFSGNEQWWSTIDNVHPSIYAWGCDGNAFIRAKYAKQYELWDKNFVGYGNQVTDFAYTCLLHGLSCVTLKDIWSYNVDHDKPLIIQKGTAESKLYFENKWHGAYFPQQNELKES